MQTTKSFVTKINGYRLEIPANTHYASMGVMGYQPSLPTVCNHDLGFIKDQYSNMADVEYIYKKIVKSGIVVPVTCRVKN